MAKQVTIYQVAAHAGVSRATVSRVMNGLDTVNPEMVARVQASMAELGYRPNAVARGLASGAYRTIGVVVPDLGNPYFTDILNSIVAAASADDYRVVVADSGGEIADEIEACRRFEPYVDAMALVSPRMPADDLCALSEQGRPVVLIGRLEPDAELPAVVADTRAATLRLATHLAELGHRRIVHLAGSPLSWQSEQRLLGIEDARALGVEVTVVRSGAGIADGYRATPEALEHQPTAIMAYSDLAAFGVLTRLHELGLRVPDEVSVTGFDDIEIARYLRPALTTAISPKTELGQRAWVALHALLAGDAAEACAPLSSALVVRESTGPAAAR